jgi:hypothetical protein
MSARTYTKEAIVIAVLDGGGKLVMESIVEIKASSILQFIHGLRRCSGGRCCSGPRIRLPDAVHHRATTAFLAGCVEDGGLQAEFIAELRGRLILGRCLLRIANFSSGA